MPDILFMSLKLVLAGLFGGVVGYEREVHEHPAGLRTHILVCMGAALITMVSVSFMPPFGDPGRIAAQIVSGIGFLGAGTILRQGSIVRGLTTAASLWTVAGIGMAVGVGGVFYVLAAVATGIVFITLSTMRSIEPILGKRATHSVRLEVREEELRALGDAIQNLTQMGASVQSIKAMDTTAEGRRVFMLKVALPRRLGQDQVVDMLAQQPGLERFEWT